MKKTIAVAAFLLVSTGFVFARQSAVATAAPNMQSQSTQSESQQIETPSSTPNMSGAKESLIAQIQALETSIAQAESRTAMAINSAKRAMVAVVAKPVVAVVKPETKTPATSGNAGVAATAPAIPYYNQQTYNSGNGALMYANGTPVQAPPGARQSASGLWFSGRQAYELAPSVGVAYAAPVASTVTNVAPVVVGTKASTTSGNVGIGTTTRTRSTSSREDDD